MSDIQVITEFLGSGIMNTYGNVLECIGHTPMIRLAKLDEGTGSQIYAKVEGLNPGGSIKDRAALFMIRDAEEKGLLKEGSVIIEPTSGNTGVGLSMIGAYLGYRCIIVMPDTMSAERISLMKAFGAEVVLTPGDEGMSGAIKRAEELKEELGGFIPSQFKNPANTMSHVITTSKEILEQVPDVDYVVAGIGSAGTATGLGMGFKKYSSKAKVIGVEPAASPMITEGRSAPHKIQGIGANFIPENLNLDYIDEVITITDDESIEMTRRLVREEGIFAGISSGAAIAAAIRLASERKGSKIVAILPDHGDRYLSTGIFE